MYRPYEFLLYPTKEQEQKLLVIREKCRLIYNECITTQREIWEKEKKVLKKFDLMKSARQKKTKPYMDISRTLISDMALRVDGGYQKFLSKKGGKPHYKKKGRQNSFTFIDAGRNDGIAMVFQYENGKCKSLKNTKNLSSVVGRKLLRISGVGEIKIKLSQDMEGDLKTITIKYKNKKWYAIFTRANVEPDILEKTGKEIGGDYGVSKLLTLSDGKVYENDRPLHKATFKLKNAQRDLSRKKKGSKRREKAKLILSKQHEKVARIRKDQHNKIANDLVKNYDFIGLEDLSVKKMLENDAPKSLHKSISDCGWRSLENTIVNKAQETGKTIVKVNPAHTSQDCFKCGNRVKKELSERIHNCKVCGYIEDRDINAAKNILKKAKKKYEEDTIKEQEKSLVAGAQPTSRFRKKKPITVKPSLTEM